MKHHFDDQKNNFLKNLSYSGVRTITLKQLQEIRDTLKIQTLKFHSMHYIGFISFLVTLLHYETLY